MFLSHLKLVNFKNYEDIEVDFNPKINCLIGNNGVGKTNVLDSIYYLSFCKSCFNYSDAQNIRHSQDFFAIHGRYKTIIDTDQESTVSCIYKMVSGKNMIFNKKKYSRFASHIGKIPLVMISPNDQLLITDGSEIRRRFIDGIISQKDHQYLELLMHYQKALEQRNRLLKDFAENRYRDEESLLIWDEQLVRYGEPIYKKRIQFLNAFIELFKEFYSVVSSSSGEQVTIQYDSQLNNEDFNELLIQNRTKDIYLQYTSIGIHKDDLSFSLNGYPIKKIGSQGQQKSFSLSLKLANFEYLKINTNQIPLLLLDDIFDKLDAHRVKHIIKLVSSNQFGQIFITDTQQQRLHNLFDEVKVPCQIFDVNNNQITIQ